MSKKKRVNSTLNSGNISSFHTEDITAILRAADELITSGAKKHVGHVLCYPSCIYNLHDPKLEYNQELI